MPSTISAGTTAGTAIAVAGDTTGNLAFQTNGTTTAMTIDTSQNVGIGTASPAARLDTQVSSGNTIARFINTVSGSGLGEIILAAPNRPAVRTNYQTSVDSNGFFNYDSGEFIWFANSGGSAVERGRFDSSGNFRFNSGYGSVATAYGCRAWVNFNGTGTPAIRGSGNVSSITDNSQGDFTVNFTNAMPDAVYATVAACSTADSQVETVLNVNSQTSGAPVSPTTTATRMVISKSGVGRKDPEFVCVSIFR